jgi:HD-like signal output (HDOD) protein
MEPLTTRDAIVAAARTRRILPAATLRVVALAQDPDHSVQEICDAIALEPALAAQVIRVSNSALFRPRTPILSVCDAVTWLGSRRLLEAVVASLGNELPDRVPGYDLVDGAFWMHAVAVSLATQELAAVMKRPLPAAAFTAGLLSDIGKLVMAPYLARERERVDVRAHGDGVPYDQAERDVLGIDHAEAGGILLESWSMPAVFVAAVRWHHDPERCPHEHRDTADIVHLADCLCGMAGFGLGLDGVHYEPCGSTADRLGYTNVLAERAIGRTAVRLEELGDVFMIEKGKG